MNGIHPHRVYPYNRRDPGRGPVVYWMSRDQRSRDNWALLYAQERALELEVPLVVVFTLASSFLNATIRQFGFMLRGLAEVEADLRALNISFKLLAGTPGELVRSALQELDAALLVTDLSPLSVHRSWKHDVASGLDIPLDEVDAHNIVPVRHASVKQEFAAYTIRPKIRALVSEFLNEFPRLRRHPHGNANELEETDWKKAIESLRVDTTVQEVTWLSPGEKSASSVLDRFIEDRSMHYALMRNDPTQSAQSDLSPYLHFGQISAQRVALEVQRRVVDKPSREAFLEELIVRRELAENFCFYNKSYETIDAFPSWARRTLDEHRKDPRPYNYTRSEFEYARTHDDLWNAAQTEMVTTGKMHGYMRMYWAKKILEWTASPEEALEIAVLLNDRYELDGRDPNGYAGIAWSIGGVHDRAWFDRPVFGKVRYMNREGCKRKFRIHSYIEKYLA